MKKIIIIIVIIALMILMMPTGYSRYAGDDVTMEQTETKTVDDVRISSKYSGRIWYQLRG